MKSINMVLFTLWFFAVVIFAGNMYASVHLTRDSSMTITIILSILLAAGYAAELFFTRKKEQERE